MISCIPSFHGRRVVRRPGSPAHGQALIEFALGIALLITIVVSTLAFLPAFTARGATLEAGAAALQRATSYLASGTGTPAGDRGEVCRLVYAAAYDALGAATALGAEPLLDLAKVTRDGGCTDGAVASAEAPFVVDVHAVGADGTTTDDLRLIAGQEIEVCVSYRFSPAGGIWWLMTNVPVLERASIAVTVFRYCGRDTIEANRSR